MLDFIRRLLQPLVLAGLFALAAVGTLLRYVSPERLLSAWLLLGVFTVTFLTMGMLQERQRILQSLLLLLMPVLALTLIWMDPRPGVAPVLLVVWTATAMAHWSVRVVLISNLIANVLFFAILHAADLKAPLQIVLVHSSFQAFGMLCVYYAKNAERARDLLALVNADLLATRALLADSARDAERIRVARELHDVAGHKLTAMKLNLRVLASDPDLAQRSEVMIAEQLSSELLADIRNVVQAMRDSHGLDMQTALRALAAPMPRPLLALEVDEQVHISDPVIAETILRVVQEAMTNAAKHADADTLSVALHQADGRLLLDIQDDGRVRGNLREGNGIAGMRERVACVEGSLLLGTTALGGMHLQVSLPA
ncbi:MAG: histidine kinase [Pseudoxanthomonas sp.]